MINQFKISKLSERSRRLPNSKKVKPDKIKFQPGFDCGMCIFPCFHSHSNKKNKIIERIMDEREVERKVNEEASKIRKSDIAK